MNSEIVLQQVEPVIAKFKQVLKLDTKAIIAGGCPRDWMLGKFCDDVDIYVQLPLPYNTLTLLFDSIFGKSNQNNSVTSYYFNSTNYIKYILNYRVKGIKYQIIVLKDDYNRYELLKEFKVNSSEIYITLGGGIHNTYKKQEKLTERKKEIKVYVNYSKDFLSFLEYKDILYCGDKYLDTDKYINKLKNKFKDYNFLKYYCNHRITFITKELCNFTFTKTTNYNLKDLDIPFLI
jgi:hypothetical protein